MATRRLKVEVAAGFPERQWVLALEVPEGSTVQDALSAADLPRTMPGVEVAPDRVGVFGRLCSLATPLKDGDRIEIYRPLTADPKEIRRQLAALERQEKQSASQN